MEALGPHPQQSAGYNPKAIQQRRRASCGANAVINLDHSSSFSISVISPAQVHGSRGDAGLPPRSSPPVRGDAYTASSPAMEMTPAGTMASVGGVVGGPSHVSSASTSPSSLRNPAGGDSATVSRRRLRDSEVFFPESTTVEKGRSNLSHHSQRVSNGGGSSGGGTHHHAHHHRAHQPSPSSVGSTLDSGVAGSSPPTAALPSGSGGGGGGRATATTPVGEGVPGSAPVLQHKGQDTHSHIGTGGGSSGGGWLSRHAAAAANSSSGYNDSTLTPVYGTDEASQYLFGRCRVSLNVAVMLNIFVTVIIVALLSIFPLDAVSMRSMEHVTSTLSSSLSNTLARSLQANMYYLPLAVKNFASAWMLDRTRRAWNWDNNSMELAMQQICEQLSLSRSTSHLLYLYMSSPISGFGAYCSSQYSDDFMVGQYTTDNETTYRYRIDSLLYTYAVPLRPYQPVKRMNQWDYTVDFGGLRNPWHNVALPWYQTYLESDVTSDGTFDDGWWVFTENNVSVVTFSYPFVDYNGNLAIISGALQPEGISTVFPDGLLTSDIGKAMVVDPIVGMVFLRSWNESMVIALDNWNFSCPCYADAPKAAGLYMDQLTDPLMVHTLEQFGGQEGLANKPSNVMRWQVRFDDGGTQVLALANRIMNHNSNLNLIVIYVVKRSEYTANIQTVRTAVITSVVVILFIIALVDLVLIYLFLQPLRGVAVGLRDAAQLRDGTHAVEGRISIIKEVADMQYHFHIMNCQLMRMKAFLPQGVLGPMTVYSGTESRTSDFGESMSPGDSTGVEVIEMTLNADPEDDNDGGGDAARSNGRRATDGAHLHLNERVLFDDVNKFRRRYCTVIVISMHLREFDTSVSVVESLCVHFMESVIPSVLRHGGVLEVQRPDFMMISFGAHSRIPMHQTKAAKCALEIMDVINTTTPIGPRVGCLIDVGEYYVGTCGAAQRNARVTYGLRVPLQAELVKLFKSLDCQILVTQRLASTLDDNMLTIPVDSVQYTLSSKYVILYELRGSVKQLPAWVSELEVRQVIKSTRNAFTKMMQGDYAAAVDFLAPFETVDRQVARLAQMCRVLCSRRVDVPFVRSIGHIKFSETNADYGGDAGADHSKSQNASGQWHSDTSPGGSHSRGYYSPQTADLDPMALLAPTTLNSVPTRMIGAVPAPEPERGGGLTGHTGAATATGVSSVSAASADGADATAGDTGDGDGDVALFEMFLDDEDPDDDMQVLAGEAAGGLEGGGGGAGVSAAGSAVGLSNGGPITRVANTVTAGLPGELPLKFIDYEGNAWTRSADVLGKGAFSVVYRGLSESGNLVALKCFQLRAKNIDIAVVTEEVRLFARLHHENIVQYVSVFVSDSYMLEIMEFVPGGSLDTLLSSFGRLSKAAVRRFLRDVLRGLGYLHSMSIVHCDVKPHNVLLAMDGQCKLSDFGSALAKATSSVGRIDDVLEMRGTPAYMAPEVALGDVPTVKSDVYSLGVTVLELLLGRLPWQYANAEEAAAYAAATTLRRPSLPHLPSPVTTYHQVPSQSPPAPTSAGAPPPRPSTAPLKETEATAGLHPSSSAAGSLSPGVVRSPLTLDQGPLEAPHGNGSDSGTAPHRSDLDSADHREPRRSCGETGSTNSGGTGEGRQTRASSGNARRPIEQVLKSPTQLVIHISRGLVVPHIPDTMDEEVADFLALCVHPDPDKRATIEELTNHPWLM